MARRRVFLSLLLVLVIAAGGIAPVGAEGDSTYVVRRGDALETIAARFGTSVAALVDANGLRNADRIKAGDELRVPVPAAASDQPASSSGRSYVVVAGDTLESIAVASGVTVADIVSASELVNPHFLQIGQRLTLPAPRSRRSLSPVHDDLNVIAPDPIRRPYLYVPYRTQFDGTTFGDSNCGPATLGMLMAYYGEWWSSHGIRRDVNSYTGDWSTDGGSDWESLVRAARKRGFSLNGPYEGNGYRRWTIDDLVAEVKSDNPPMLLVRYRLLPGHANGLWWGDHYIVFLGLTDDGQVVYHDSAFEGDGGAYLTMSQQQLMRAWGNNLAGIQYSALSLRWP